MVDDTLTRVNSPAPPVPLGCCGLRDATRQILAETAQADSTLLVVDWRGYLWYSEIFHFRWQPTQDGYRCTLLFVTSFQIGSGRDEDFVTFPSDAKKCQNTHTPIACAKILAWHVVPPKHHVPPPLLALVEVGPHR